MTDPADAARRPRAGEPIAVIGIGCRLPGGIESPDGLWRALLAGLEAPAPPPADRRSWVGDAPGAFLADPFGFDAAFFGIDPAAAAAMDPRQRILLETTWAAFEHAGLAPATLRGSRTGVFAGVSAAEHPPSADPASTVGQGVSGGFDPRGSGVEGDSAVGHGMSGQPDLRSPDGDPAPTVAQGVSGGFDPRGSGVEGDSAVGHGMSGQPDLRSPDGDPASTVAHAVSAHFDLRGPSLDIDTGNSASLVAVHQAVRALAAGEAALAVAAGVRVLLTPSPHGPPPGEGCGVVVLKRLADARRDGDRVLAVVRGSAVGSDGRGPGLSAQEQVLADAHAVAGSDPSTVDYVEAHRGDAVETQALDVVLGRGRATEHPAEIGFGATSGILGLIKVVLALWHDRLPRPSEMDWPRYSGTARAGVSAFSGTNAHVVLEEWPKPLEPVAPGSRWNGRPQVFAVSARSEPALRRRAGELADWLAGPGRDVAPGDLAAVLARRREPLPLRAAVVTASRAALIAGLRAVAAGGTTADVVRGTAGRERPRPVFVFSGPGSQWAAMGRRMLGAEPAFRAAVAELEPLFLAKAGFSLRGALRRPLGDPAAAPPLVFGTQVALAAWWRAHGVEPAAVLGHSTGEIAAAVVAGALDAGTGLDIVVNWAKLLSDVPAGATAVVELSAAELGELGFPDVTIAEYASPVQCTVSGSAEQIAALVTRVDGLGRFARRGTGAAHTAAVDAVLGRFRASLGELRPRPPATPCYSSVLDDPRAVPAFDVDYWTAGLRRPVRFTQAVAAAVADGHRWFVEVSPHPIALPAVEQTAAGLRVLPSLSRRDGEENAFARSVAELHVAGHPAVLARRHPEAPVLDLPPPPWDHRRFPPPRPTAGHPLLGTRVEVPDEDRHLWQAEIAPDAPAWLGEHRVHDVPAFPATGFLELFLAGARELFGTARVRVDGLEVHRMLAVTGKTVLSTEIRADGTAVVRAKAASGPWGGPGGSPPGWGAGLGPAGHGWVRHATAWVSADTDPAPAVMSEVDGAPRDVYAELDRAGQRYGPAFRGLHAVRAAGGRASALVTPSPPGYALHPVLADTCLHALVATRPEGTGEIPRPAGFGRVRLLGDPRRGVRCVAGDGVVQLVAEDGEVVADFGDVRRQALGGVPLAARAFGTTWPEAPLPPVPPGNRGSWLLLTDEHPAALGRAVALALALAGAGDEALSLPQDDLDELPGFLAERPVRGVVFLTGAPHAYHDPEDAQDLLRSVLAVVARLGPGVRFHLVTQSSGEPGLAFLRGLVRVLAFDRPGLRASLVDVDARSEVDVLARELRADVPDDDVRWRHDVRYAARLTRVPLVDGASAGPGAYVITGGFGALGRATARRLAAGGATRIVLCGRHGGPVELPGVDVVVVAGDIAEPGVADRLVAAATAGGLRLRGIVHAAAVSAEDVAAVWRPKVLGARRLHEATADKPPDWWLLYSSSAALAGSPGRTAHATADAWLDAFAAWRRARGLPATTVNWGAWAADPVLDAMPVAEGLDALPAVLASDLPSVGILRLAAGRVAGTFPELTRRPFFSAVLDGVTVPVATPGGTTLERLAGIFAGLLGCPPGEVTPEVPLIELGLDSLTAMRARAAAEREFGVPLPVPLLLRGASLADLAGRVTGPPRPAPRVLRAGEGTPLVLFGRVAGYRSLLDRLGDVPGHGLEASTVEECVERLREVRPSGPYRLGGWSAGGVLAFETAQRLTALGERVEVVVLVDAEARPGAQPYAGRVVLFRAQDADPLGWDACCPDLHVEVVPGDHRSMLDPPHVEVLARHLAAELAGHPTPGTPV
ncbi:acyltransferase domain-containing protein [Amycolatopsis sp. cmx-4-68]|uniref:type I polyketide synthase n=1 Tax=Amycolatopsis sp. cmx-4-68 TaxID=2790938 RepID=UPI00397811D0